MKKELLSNILPFLKKKLRNADVAHDFYHAVRVWKIARYIAKKEKVNNLLLLEIAALFHDIVDRKLYGEEKGKKMVSSFLKKLGFSKEFIDKVLEIILNISFSKGVVPSTIEGKIVQDADRLDALGAFGIARVFAYSGSIKRPIYNKKKNDTVYHFYEKLLKLKNLMNTKTAKKLAKRRHKFMEKFLKELKEEYKIC